MSTPTKLPRLETLAKHKGRILALDPGITTGWAWFDHAALVDCGQIHTSLRTLQDLFDTTKPQSVVMEKYIIYKTKVEQHTLSTVPTLRIVGAIQMLAWQKGAPLFLQTAAQAKFFCTDDKLKAWELFQTYKRHANDSIRHAVYYMTFGGKEESIIFEQ